MHDGAQHAGLAEGRRELASDLYWQYRGVVKVGKNEAGQRGIPFLSEQKAWFQSDHFWDFVAVIDFPGLFGNRHTFTQALSTFSHFVVSFSALAGFATLLKILFC